MLFIQTMHKEYYHLMAFIKVSLKSSDSSKKKKSTDTLDYIVCCLNVQAASVFAVLLYHIIFKW